MNDGVMLLAQILGGGVVGIGVLAYAVKLVNAVNERKRNSPMVSASQSRPECSLLSGQVTTIMNRQTDLMTQVVGLLAKMETEQNDLKAVATSNAGKLDSIVKGISVIMDRPR